MSGAWKKLIDENNVGRVALGFEAAIEKSFVLHAMSAVTADEVKRRFDICARIFEQLRGDLGWGITRILDNLPGYLNEELGGKTFTPSTRTVWAPGDD